jgi:UDPglucose 6-dehydrogenase
MKVAVVGAGRVGLSTAACLASLGHQVTAQDVDRRKIDLLVGGSVPFFEPALEELVRGGMAAGRLLFTADAAVAVAGADVAMLCVGTPPLHGGEADLAALDSATEDVARNAKGPLVVVIKSTVPVGTAERVRGRLVEVRPDGRFTVVSNPEFLREGKAVEDSLHPVRVVVGARDPEGLTAIRELYAPLLRTGVGWVETDHATAELAKHACNAFLATKVSFVNAVARVCELAGADVADIARAMGMDPRIGPSYLEAGLGYGGYCLPKDLASLEHQAEALGYEFALLRVVADANHDAMEATVRKVEAALGGLAGRHVALLGLAFKPETDNVTAAPALALGRRLIEAGATVTGYDPAAGANAKDELPELAVIGDPYSALQGADCAVVCTEWEEMANLDLARVREAMRGAVVVDGRNVFDPRTMAEAGFTYLPTGRPAREQ